MGDDMDLEELVKDPLKSERAKELATALEVAKREWNNIRESLEFCGDIGEFSKKDYMIGVVEEDVILRELSLNPSKSISFHSPNYYPIYFVRNLLWMEDKFPHKSYKTPEALYVFIELATKAAERLGLEGNLSMGFGVGYGGVRTGWFVDKGWKREREIFCEVFFQGRKVDFDWEFFWHSTKKSFRRVFDKFSRWKTDPELYKLETAPKYKIKPYMV